MQNAMAYCNQCPNLRVRQALAHIGFQAGERVNAPDQRSPLYGFRGEVLPKGKSHMAITTDAGKWLADQRAKPVGRVSAWSDARGKTPLGRHLAKKRINGPTIMEFVEANRNAETTECIFVPGALKGSPARVRFCDKTISAARYMGLLSMGAPRSPEAVVRHMCGNGHLSCVNPAHLEWGSEADNIADANRHRHCKTVQDKILSTKGGKK